MTNAPLKRRREDGRYEFVESNGYVSSFEGDGGIYDEAYGFHALDDDWSVFYGRIGSEWFVFKNYIAVGGPYDGIHGFKLVDDRPFFTARRGGKYFVVHGWDIITASYDSIRDPMYVGDALLFRATVRGENLIIRGADQAPYDEYLGMTVEGGAARVRIRRNGKDAELTFPHQ
jgi:hypothetical protein